MVLHWQLQPIPSEESLQQKLQDNTNWEAYKALTVVNHMVQHKAHGDSQFYWVNPESTVYFKNFTFYVQIVPSVKLRILKLITKFTIWQLVVILDRRKGDKDVLLSNRLAICRCFLHDECIKAFVVSVLSKWQNYIGPSYFYVVIYKKKYVQTHWSADVLSFCR